MSRPVRIRIVGSDASGTDAPTAKDFLEQLEDFLTLFENIERTVDGDETNHLVWKVTDAQMNSPLTIELTPYPKHYAENIDRRAVSVVRAVAEGVRQLSVSGEAPAYFDSKSSAAAEAILRRSLNGIARTDVVFDQSYRIDTVSVDRELAYNFVRAAEKTRLPEFRLHRELGAVEGFISRVELDGYGRPIVWLRARVDGDLIKCVSTEHGLDRIGHLEVHEVLSGLRVQVFGLINYRSAEKISSIEVEHVRVFPTDDELPSEDDIVAPGFTGGLKAEDFLKGLHSDE